MTKSTRIPTSVTSALTQTGVGFGVGYGVSKLYEEIGLNNPYANATATGTHIHLHRVALVALTALGPESSFSE